jgi:uncharacterized protein YndB with AHSA1/START domain
MYKSLLVIAIALAVCLIVLVLWALTLPKTVSASRTAVLPASPDAVFAVVAAADQQTSWRTGLASVEVRDGGVSWTEVTDRGIRIDFERVESTPSTLLVIRFSSPAGFSGDWRGEFAADGAGTRVIFTETVTTPGVLGRALARLFAPPGAHVDQYIADLRRALEPGRTGPR